MHPGYTGLQSTINPLIVSEHINRRLHRDLIIAAFLFALRHLQIFKQRTGIDWAAKFANLKDRVAKNDFYRWELGWVPVKCVF